MDNAPEGTHDSKQQVTPSVSQGKPKLPGTFALIDQAWTIFTDRLGTILAIVLIPVALSVVLGMVGAGIFSVVRFQNDGTVNWLGIAFGIILGIALILAFVLIIGWGQVALLYAIKDRGEKIGFKESYRRGWHKLASYWWVAILTGIIVGGGSLLFGIPGIIFGIWFLLATYVLVAEDVKGMDALFKSKEYVRGYWWAVFGRTLLFGILSFIASLILRFIPFGSIVASLFLGPLALIFSYLIYTNLKTIKGEVSYVATSGKKALFVILGLVGVIVIPVLFLSALLAVFSKTFVK